MIRDPYDRMRHRRPRICHGGVGISVILAFGGGVPTAIRAQTPPSGVPEQTIAPITAAAVARYLAVLQADSMRDTTPDATRGPGSTAGVARTARYITAQFERFGLRPGIRHRDDSLWIQAYRIPGQRRVETPRSHLKCYIRLNRGDRAVLNERGSTMAKDVRLPFETAVYFPDEAPPPIVPEIVDRGWLADISHAGSANVVLLGGGYTAATVPDSALQGRIVFYVPSTDVDAATRRQVLGRLYAASEGVVLVREDDRAAFADRLRAARAHPVPLVDDYLQPPTLSPHWSWVVEVRADAIRGFLGAAGADLDAIQRSTTPVWRPLPLAGVWFNPNVTGEPDSAIHLVTAPNVVAVLEGTDSTLNQEYVVVSAPMDARTPMRDEPASGVAGLLALAEAFRQPGARPRRSLVFLATSGTPTGAWGGYFFASPYGRDQLNLRQFDVLQATVANLTLDHLGRPADSGVAVVTGAEAVELPHTLASLAAAHGELGLTIRPEADMAEDSLSALDYVAFLQNAIPSLYLHDGTSNGPSSSRRVAPSGGTSDPTYVARITQLAYYLVEDLTNAPTHARLNDAGHRTLWQAPVRGSQDTGP